MQLVRPTPIEVLERFERNLDPFGDESLALLPKFAEPTLDMYEENGRLTIEIRLPSFKKNEIKVSEFEGALEILAEHRVEREETAQRRYYKRESLSSYMRRVQLPEGTNFQEAKAGFRDGILKITMPFAAPKEAKRVEIKQGGQ